MKKMNTVTDKRIKQKMTGMIQQKMTGMIGMTLQDVDEQIEDCLYIR